VIRVVVDMNLGGSWVGVLSAAGIDAVHWSSVGHPTAPDAEIFAWAAIMGRELANVLFRHQDALKRGALIMLDAARSRLRVLPLKR
jgi:predicted nuclease of predicted toxin-antitoxin system